MCLHALIKQALKISGRSQKRAISLVVNLQIHSLEGVNGVEHITHMVRWSRNLGKEEGYPEIQRH